MRRVGGAQGGACRGQAVRARTPVSLSGLPAPHNLPHACEPVIIVISIIVVCILVVVVVVVVIVVVRIMIIIIIVVLREATS